MDELRLLVKNRLSEMTKSVIASLVRWSFILDSLSVASLLWFGITFRWAVLLSIVQSHLQTWKN